MLGIKPISAIPLSSLLLTSAIVVYRPGSDVTITGWTGVPNNTNKYANINESVASDTEYISSPDLTVPTPIIMGLDSSMSAGTYDISIRSRYAGALPGRVRVLMLDGTSTVLATSSWQNLTTGYATYLLNVVIASTASRVQVEIST